MWLVSWRKKRDSETKTHEGEHHGITEAETEVLPLQGKNHQGLLPANHCKDCFLPTTGRTASCQPLQGLLPANHWKLGTGKKGFPSTGFRGKVALPISRLQKSEAIKFYCFKALSLWYFLMAVLGTNKMPG